MAAKIPITGKVMVAQEFQTQDSTLLYNHNILGSGLWTPLRAGIFQLLHPGAGD